MARSRKDFITVHLNGKTLLALALYTAMMIYIGAGLKSCQNNHSQQCAKITNVKTK